MPILCPFYAHLCHRMLPYFGKMGPGIDGQRCAGPEYLLIYTAGNTHRRREMTGCDSVVLG